MAWSFFDRRRPSFTLRLPSGTLIAFIYSRYRLLTRVATESSVRSPVDVPPRYE
jgi:hypothetical protein